MTVPLSLLTGTSHKQRHPSCAATNKAVQVQGCESQPASTDAMQALTINWPPKHTQQGRTARLINMHQANHIIEAPDSAAVTPAMLWLCADVLSAGDAASHSRAF